MPRDSQGNYTLPPVINPVVPGTVIEAEWANPTMNDVAVALTDSLSRTGAGGMLGPFRFADGNRALPGNSWVNEPTSGWYRKSLNEFWYAINGQDVFGINANGIIMGPGKEAEGISAFTNVQDDMPVGMYQGETWWESDTGMYAMRYVNPDATETLVALGAVGGDFIPFAMKGAPGGVAELDGTGVVPAAQLPVPVPPPLPDGLVPIGAVIDFAGLVAPTGWLVCDGATVARAAYADLFAAIGETWGAGDGSTTFNLPDLSRRTTVGSGGVGTAVLGNAVGNVGGAETHALVIAEMPAHTHTFPIGTGTSGIIVEADNASAFGNATTSSAGGNGAHNNVQPSAVMLKIIRAL